MADRRPNPIHYNGDLRSDLMTEALTVIASNGTSAVSLRALSRELGVSHAAPKNHFPTKEALFAEIAREGFILFEAKLTAAGEKARKNGAGPLEVLEMMGLAYLSFAEEHASHYVTMFRTDLFDQTLIDEESARAFAVLQSTVEAAQASGWHAGADSHQVATLVWSTVHGHAQLEAQGMPIGRGHAERASVLRLLVQPVTGS